AGRLRVAGVLRVLFIDLGRGSADLHIRPIAFEWTIALVTTAARLTPAPPLTLHVNILIFRVSPQLDGLGVCLANPTGRWLSLWNRLLVRGKDASVFGCCRQAISCGKSGPITPVSRGGSATESSAWGSSEVIEHFKAG